MAYHANLTFELSVILLLTRGDPRRAFRCSAEMVSRVQEGDSQPGRTTEPCPVTPESDKLRHLLYGHKPHIYRAIYRVLEKQKQVEALHIRTAQAKAPGGQMSREPRQTTLRAAHGHLGSTIT